MSDDGGGASAPQIKFIRDSAAEADFFGRPDRVGSHDRVAKAVASVISTNDDLKVIGLLGPWGSGKSTVVRLIQRELKADETLETHVFCYDAWLHQSDPPRRAFLETLLQFLIDRDLTTQERWQTQLDILNRQIEDTTTTATPSLTAAGRLLLLSLFCLPFGMQFIGHDWFEAAFKADSVGFAKYGFWFGLGLLVVPPLLALLTYLWWRPRWNPLSPEFRSWDNWRKHKPPHQDESLLSIFVNKQVEKHLNRTIRTPDPTTIEFQQIFRDIIKEVSAKKVRLILVIDNLDRLHEAEAVSMWGTIRSFFLGAEMKPENGKALRLPTVLLPIDQDAVERMYKIDYGDDAPALAQSFMEKTFDLTFYVTKPVLSDWSDYLADQLSNVFGAELKPDWAFQVSRLYEKAHDKSEITPRSINVTINDIATLWIQWRDEEVSFVSIAYFVIFRDNIGKEIFGAIHNPVAAIADLDPDWQQNVAALYFGAPPAEAIQIMVEPRLWAAMEKRNAVAFKEQATIKGFDGILQRVLDKISPAEPAFIANAAILMAELAPPDEPWVASIWQTLRRLYIEAKPWGLLSKYDVAALKALLAASSKTAAKSLITQTASRLSTSSAEMLSTPASIGNFLSLANEMVLTTKTHDMPAPTIGVPGNASQYLSAIVAAKESNSLVAALTTDFSDQELVDTLTELIGAAPGAEGVEERLKTLLNRGVNDVKWDNFILKAREVFQSQIASFAGSASAIYALGRFWKNEAVAQKQVRELAENGMLKSRMDEAIGLGKPLVAARCAALLMMVRQSLGAPNGGSWADTIKTHPNFPALVDNALRLFDASGTFHHLVERSKQESDDVRRFMRAIAEIRIKQGQMGGLYIQDAINDLDAYLEMVGPNNKSDFLAEFSGYPTFWEKLGEAGFDKGVIIPLHSLIATESTFAKKGTKQKAQEALKERLLAVKAAAWEASIRNGGDPIGIAQALAETRKRGLGLGDPLYQALHRLAPELVSSETREFGARWFQASKFLSVSSKRTILKNLRDQINSGNTIPNLVGLLRFGGEDFLTAGEFAQDGDASVRHIVMSLLNDSTGLRWLVENVNTLSAWIAASTEDSRKVLVDRMTERWPELNDEDKSRLEVLAKAWTLPDPKAA